MSERRVVEVEGVVDNQGGEWVLENGTDYPFHPNNFFTAMAGRHVRVTFEVLDKCEKCGKWTPNGRTSMGQICDSCHYALAKGGR